MAVFRLDNESTVQLGAVLARAGEGTVYEVVDHPEWVVKIFHPDLKDPDAKRAKVATMITSQPPGAVQSDGFVVLTWPLHTVESDDGATGYLMSRVDTTNAVEIHALSNPANRANPLPSAPQWTAHATWAHLVSIAANLCLAVESVHRVNAVIGDFQERNILVNDTTRVTLVDCDSMQFTSPDGHQFLCPVGRPEFTAPELAGTSLAQSPREQPSDLFALAVHIHLLLMAGNHPFLRGQWTGPGEQPDAMTLAQSGQWAGGPNSQLRTHPLAPPITFLPNTIQQLFVKAFTDGAHNPAARPTATQWRQALLDVRTTTCTHGHQIPVEADPCPWCTIDTERTALQQQRATAPIGGNRPTNPPRTAAPPTPPATPPPSYTAPTPPTNNNRTPLIIAAAAVAIIAIITGAVALTSNNNGGNASPNRNQASGSSLCVRTPDVEGISTDLTPSGLSVGVRLTSDCSSDQVLTGSSVLVRVSDSQSNDIASGYFDLAASPISFSVSGSQTQQFVFPAGMYWRTPELIGSSPLNVNIANASFSRSSVYAAHAGPVIATAPGSPIYGDAEGAASSALLQLANADYLYVRENLADRWVPQISSKRLGLVTDGITYGNPDILRDHLSLRQRYEGVRLVFSNSWTVFNGSDWWVTLVGSPYGDAAAANGWCDSNGIDSWNCFAKLVSDHVGPEGTTVIRR